MSDQANATFSTAGEPTDAEFVPGGLLGELDAQQDDVIRRLDELNFRIERLMRDWSRVAFDADVAGPVGSDG